MSGRSWQHRLLRRRWFQMPNNDAVSDSAELGPRVTVGTHVAVRALPGIPLIKVGDDLATLLVAALKRGGAPKPCDVIVVASKLLSRSEGAYVDLSTVKVGEEAMRVAREVQKDPRLVQVILDDSAHISRSAPGVLITRHRLGHISANAGIDTSNATPSKAPSESGPWVLRLPADPDATARNLRTAIQARFGVTVGVMVTDSLGRPFRNGSLGHAIGLAGLPALSDERGRSDLCERPLEHTFAAVADMVAAAADLVMGQAGEGRGAAVLSGLQFKPVDNDASALQRDPQRDLYA